MEPNLKRPLQKMGKNDQKVDAQADRPANKEFQIQLQ